MAPFLIRRIACIPAPTTFIFGAGDFSPHIVPPHLLHHKRENHNRLRSEEHTSELQSLMRISYAVFCLKKKNRRKTRNKWTITINKTNNKDTTIKTHK